jgi:hypothetical protein
MTMSLAFSSGDRSPTRAAPTTVSARQPATTGRARLQRKAGHCACGGGCPRCGSSSPLKVGAPGDAHEREAESVSDRLMRLAPTAVADTSEPVAGITPQARVATSSDAAAPASVHRALASPGQPLASDTRRFFESAFSHDFSTVRVHTDAAARQSAEDLHARAYTLGHDVVLGAGAAATTSPADRRLLAHELTHVVQQHGGSSSTVMRSCSDEDFCRPYDSQEEIDDSKWWLTNTYMRAEGVETYGTEVKGLYESFLSRSPGDSLDPVIFDSDSSYLVSAFKSSWDTKDDMDAVIEMVGNRLSRAPGWPMRDGDRWGMSLANFLSADEMANRPINYSNPLSVAGHIAGNIGSSAAGDDYRKITYGNVTLEKTVLLGNTGYVSVELTPRYEVFDAIDFCPGDCGSYAEQWVTIPMSRLEASGAAYDVPFKVRFTPETRSERFWF